MSQYTIKATHGLNGIPPVQVEVETKKGVWDKQIYDRYVQDLIFSKDDKMIALCIRNGPEEFHIQVYNMEIRGQYIGKSVFHGQINKVAFMPRDNKMLAIAGDNIMRCYGVNNLKQLEVVSDFNGIPERSPQLYEGRMLTQNFTSFCYTACDHIIGCSILGDLFVI